MGGHNSHATDGELVEAAHGALKEVLEVLVRRRGVWVRR